MNKAYKYRIYPNKHQEKLFIKTFGCIRFYWNNLVSAFNSYDKEENPEPLFLTTTQIRKEYEWMKEVSYAAMHSKWQDFFNFRIQYFKKDRAKAIGRPTFKKKGDLQSFRLSNTKFYVNENKIKLVKIGWVDMVIDRKIPIDAKYISATISKNKSNQYFISLVVEQDIYHKPKTNKSVGIDVGLKEFYVSSDNIVVGNPKFFRESQSKLKKARQHLSRKKKGSNRYFKSKFKVAKLHQKVTNQRDWFLHNHSTKLVTDYDVIIIEDLNIVGMVKNHTLAKSISDASWGKFFNMLDYKCKWYGKQLIKIGRFEPTSKTCSCCGWHNPNLKLSDRTFTCKQCGVALDRDYNAALNIKALGVDGAIRTLRDLVISPVEAFN